MMRLLPTALSLGLAAMMTTAAVAETAQPARKAGARHTARSAVRPHVVASRASPVASPEAPATEPCNSLACPNYLLIGVDF